MRKSNVYLKKERKRGKKIKDGKRLGISPAAEGTLSNIVYLSSLGQLSAA